MSKLIKKQLANLMFLLIWGWGQSYATVSTPITLSNDVPDEQVFFQFAFLSPKIYCLPVNLHVNARSKITFPLVRDKDPTDFSPYLYVTAGHFTQACVQQIPVKPGMTITFNYKRGEGYTCGIT